MTRAVVTTTTNTSRLSTCSSLTCNGKVTSTILNIFIIIVAMTFLMTTNTRLNLGGASAQTAPAPKGGSTQWVQF